MKLTPKAYLDQDYGWHRQLKFHAEIAVFLFGIF